MTTKLILAAAIAISAFSGSAFASFAPIKYEKSRETVAQACAMLGSRGESYGLERQAGEYGCRNTENGNAVRCTADGKCTDYSGDPRWKNIQILLKGGKGQKAMLLKM